MNVKRLVKEIARLEKSNDVRALKALKKELDTLKKAPANAIRNSIGVNEKGFTRFNHKPDNMIVTSAMLARSLDRSIGKASDGIGG